MAQTQDNPFEEYAEITDLSTFNAHNRIAGAQIRVAGLQYLQQEKMNNTLARISHDATQLTTGVNNLKSSIDKFNDDTGKLYRTLNFWTIVIAGAAIASAIATIVNVSPTIAAASKALWKVCKHSLHAIL